MGRPSDVGPDAAEKGGRYYLYFPVKDKEDVFRIGVAVGSHAAGAVQGAAAADQGHASASTLLSSRIPTAGTTCTSAASGAGSCSAGRRDLTSRRTSIRRRISRRSAPRVARLGDDMVSLAEPPRDVVLLDETGKPLRRGRQRPAVLRGGRGCTNTTERTTFSYSTGDTHNIMYATGKSPYGPFTVRGKILEPVLGWTNHHSIVEFQGKWYLFYHDAQRRAGRPTCATSRSPN